MKAAYQETVELYSTKALIERRSLETSFTLSQYLQAGRSFSPLLNIVVSLCKQVAPLFFFINLLKQKVIFTMSLCDCDDELEYKLLTRDKVEDALAIQAETMKQENLAIGLGMFEEDGAPEEMNLLFREVIKDGMTLIAVDKRTDEVAAVAFNKLRAKPRKGEKDELDSFIEENLKHQTCRKLIKFLDDIDNVDIFERYDTNGAMEVFYLGTDPRYQGRGIGRRMMQECIGFGRGLLNGTRRRTSIDGVILEQSVIPSIIFGVFASNYSQRIADKLGFHVLHEVRYDDYASNGRKMSERIGSVHKTARLQVLKL